MNEVKWIKISTDIFDDEKIYLIEDMPEADTILVIWLKLLVLAGKKNADGVFMLTETMPYTDETFAAIFRRPLKTVRLALATFQQLGMVEIVEGAVTIPKWEKHQNITALRAIRERDRERKRKERAQVLAASGGSKADQVRAYLAANPNQSLTQAAKELGVNKRTVFKYAAMTVESATNRKEIEARATGAAGQPQCGADAPGQTVQNAPVGNSELASSQAKTGAKTVHMDSMRTPRGSGADAVHHRCSAGALAGADAPIQPVQNAPVENSETASLQAKTGAKTVHMDSTGTPCGVHTLDVDIDEETSTSHLHLTTRAQDVTTAMEGDVPSLDEVVAFCHAHGLSIDPARFHTWYSQRAWTTKNRQPVDDWRRMCLTWEHYQHDASTIPTRNLTASQTAPSSQSTPPIEEIMRTYGATREEAETLIREGLV